MLNAEMRWGAKPAQRQPRQTARRSEALNRATVMRGKPQKQEAANSPRLGLLLHALVHPADIRDHEDSVLVRKTRFLGYPLFRKPVANGGHQGPVFAKG